MNDRARMPGLLVLVVLGCLMISALRDPWVPVATERESEVLVQAFGKGHAERLALRASQWHQDLIEDTGIRRWCREVLTGTPQARARSGEFAHGPWAEGINGVERRFDQVFEHVQLVFRRLSVLVFCLPALLPFVLACLIDGWVRRRIRQTGFAYASPLVHRLALWVIRMASLLLLLVLLWPAVVPIGIAPGVLVVIALTMGIALTHTQKKL
ncbi:MAG: DUF4400 domain-containing protein [Ahniella sp.]|nr:DUF4400 domain-containing protein [Ahniella sp.]